MREQGRAGRFRRRAATAAVVVLVGAAAWWAGSETAVQRVGTAEPPVSRVLATVAPITVGRTLTYSATVEQPFEVVASNALEGVVTSVAEGSQVDVGDVLYTVGSTPVHAVTGAIPFWRDLAQEVEGTDVAQLQQALVDLGLRSGRPDGKFGAETARAVRAWQKQGGQEATGTVPLGTLVAVPALPTAVVLDEAVQRGLVVAGGEPAVLARTDAPRFALVLSEDQAAPIRPGTRVDVLSGQDVWGAVVSTIDASPDQDGTVELTLTAPDGTSPCGSACDALPAQEAVYLTAKVHVSEQVEGPGVPVAAVRTDASGTTYVVMGDGRSRPVSVRGSADGMAVIDGLAVGDEIVLLDGAGVGAGAPAATADPAGADSAD